MNFQNPMLFFKKKLFKKASKFNENFEMMKKSNKTNLFKNSRKIIPLKK
jgi:hypothetical protein